MKKAGEELVRGPLPANESRTQESIWQYKAMSVATDIAPAKMLA